MSTAMAFEPWQMRYCAHLGFPTHETPYLRHLADAADPVAQIACAARLGFAGMSDNGLMLRSAAEQTRIGEALKAHDMLFDTYVAGPEKPLRPWNSDAPSDVALLKEELQLALEAGVRVSAAGVVVTAGLRDDMPFDAQLAVFAGHLTGWAFDQARNAGVPLLVEAISPTRLPGAMITRIADACVLARMTDGRLGVVFDTLHVSAEGDDLIETFRAGFPFIANVQLTDNDRLEPGAGSLKLGAFVRTVRESGYDGLVALEHRHSQPGQAGERLSLARLAALDAPD